MSFPRRVLSALNYNETKVRQGRAECLGASGYLREAGAMNVYQKLQGLERRNELNSRATTKTLHVSLNFHPSEQLSDATLLQIAAEYLQRIGFGGQPYLVYRHWDAGHPHLHVVSTTIRADGSRIPTHNLGRQQSAKARREVEDLFGLVRAGRQKAADVLPDPLRPLAVQYGSVETKQSLAAVVEAVFGGYAFASLPEYNAALQSFGVLADRGTEGGIIYRHGGLVYRILDASGAKVGVPIKASDLPGSPTLSRLRLRFSEGAQKKESHRAALREKIDRCLAGSPAGLPGLLEALKKEGVSAQLHRSKEGRLYGITFVDHGSRCVFKGSDVGREYGAAGLHARLVAPPEENTSVAREEHTPVVRRAPPSGVVSKVGAGCPLQVGLAEGLLASAPPAENIPYGLLQKKKRKKKRTPPT